jgi:hypothetical protein
MSSILKSRKFWIMLVDVIISSATYFIAHYVSPELGENIIWLIGAWQPVIYAVIAGIATEDAANVTAQSVVDVANVSAQSAVEVAVVNK